MDNNESKEKIESIKKSNFDRLNRKFKTKLTGKLSPIEKSNFDRLNRKFKAKLPEYSPTEKFVLELQYGKSKKKLTPPEKGPQSQGMKFGGMGCPYRETGVRSDIKGIKPIQLFGKSFKGVK